MNDKPLDRLLDIMRRFQAIEQRLNAEGRQLEACSLTELDALWNEVKTQ